MFHVLIIKIYIYLEYLYMLDKKKIIKENKQLIYVVKKSRENTP